MEKGKSEVCRSPKISNSDEWSYNKGKLVNKEDFHWPLAAV